MFRIGVGLPSVVLSPLRHSLSLPKRILNELGVGTTVARNLSPYSTGECLSPKDVREVQIPVPWGHISGKWWGSSDVQPVLCLHGWQDNAGTWDRLAPLLPSSLSLLSLDLPGHGLSSHFHPGRTYHMLEYVLCLRRILRHFGWERASFLTHSLGAIVTFVFSAIYPAMVDRYVAVDAMKPYGAKPQTVVSKGGGYIDRLIAATELHHHATPSYTYEEAAGRLVQGTKNSVTAEVVACLLARGLEEMPDGRYRYRRDQRLKVQQSVNWTQAAIVSIAEEVRCDVCHIVADPGLAYDTPEKHREVSDVVRRVGQSYEHHVVEGGHHVHLTEPHKVAPIVIKFLCS